MVLLKCTQQPVYWNFNFITPFIIWQNQYKIDIINAMVYNSRERWQNGGKRSTDIITVESSRKRWLKKKRKSEWVTRDKVDGASLAVNMVWFGDLFMALIYSAAKHCPPTACLSIIQCAYVWDPSCIYHQDKILTPPREQSAFISN